MTDYATARRHMVEGQIKPNRVTDVALMDRFSVVPREKFVPGPLRASAYVDEDLPIGDGRYLMEPMVLARLMDAAAISEEDLVLSIGAGTGYGVAVMAALASTVVGVDSDSGFVARAGETLSDLEIDNAVILEGELAVGYPDQAPFDVILFEGAVADVPSEVFEQLSDKGRLLAVVNDGSGGLGEATVWIRTTAGLGRRTLFEAGTPHLPGLMPEPAFEF